MLTPRFVLLLLAGCAACGDDGPSDAGPDGPPDPCAPEMTFTGEFISWDSSATSFMGIPAAVFTHRMDTSKTATSAPNGRFDLMCIPAADGFVDVTSSTVVPGTVVVDRDVLTLQPTQSYRSFTPTRAADFGFDAALGHVYVHVEGNGTRTVTTAAAPGVQKTFDGTNWVDGNAGADIYLGNIAPGTTTLNVTGGNTIGGGSIPITAGQFTWITIVAY